VNPAVGRDHERLYLPTLLGGALLCALLVGGANYAVDPLQIYRRAAYPAVFSENQRHQNAGLIRSYDYTTIIVGNSHVENFSPAFIERVTGEPTIKLAIEGSQASEQAAMVEKAIETGHVQRVIWGLDHLAFRDSTLSPWGGARLPRYLYEPSLATVGRYLLSLDTLELSANALLGRGHRSLETLNRWGESAQYGPPSVARSWRRIRRNVAREKARPGNDFSPTITMTRRKIDRLLVPLVRANPDVRFDLYFSPFSVIAYSVDQLVSDHEFEERLAFKRSVVEAVGSSPNVRVFDFQAVRGITHELDRYKDVHHFDPAVNDWIIRSMERDEHRVTPANIDDALRRHAEQVRSFSQRACSETGPRLYCVEGATPEPAVR
jgi:hypothetical protein